MKRWIINLIQIRKDEVKHLQKIGLGKYIIAKTCHGKKFAEENRKVMEALRKYNASGIMEV